MTRGIEDPRTYYYRRLLTDAVRAVDVARDLPGIDPDVSAAVAFVPFLSDTARATLITDAAPYSEIAGYLTSQRSRVEQVARTLSYVDGVNFARRVRTRIHYSVALMDPICPPSTVFAGFNANASESKTIDVWPYNGHEGGGPEDRERAIGVISESFAA
jgi:cephalosporin-C deacetylase